MWTEHPKACSLDTGKWTKDLEKMPGGNFPSLLNRVKSEIRVASSIAKVQSSVDIISGQKVMTCEIIERALDYRHAMLL